MRIKELSIISYGFGWLAVDKPSGMSVHNDPGKDVCSVMSVRIRSDEHLQKEICFDSAFGVHAVHRLDRETSGLMLLACNSDAFEYLSKQFRDRMVKKRYVALLHGVLSPFTEPTENWYEWRFHLTQKSGGRKFPAGIGKKLPSLTKYRILEQSIHYTLIECEPVTGRTHQIRRHAKLAGHPIVGDRRYGTPRSLQYLKTHNQFDRLGLHSTSIYWILQETSQPYTLQLPCVPLEFRKLLDEDTALR